jgi:hypothetical protein
MTPALTRQRLIEGVLALIAFVATIPAANWMIQHVGTVCVPDGPCLIPVAPGLMAPSGVITIGLAFVLRDIVQRRLGVGYSAAAVCVGAAVSATLAPAPLVLASGLAFLVAELLDLGVYTPLQKRGFVRAAVASSIVGVTVDSIIFLTIAFGSLDFLLGQVVGKIGMVLLTIPFLILLRRRDEARGL